MRVANLSKQMKPAIGGQLAGESSHRALRGGWGRRVRIDESRNLGDPRCFFFFGSRESDSP